MVVIVLLSVFMLSGQGQAMFFAASPQLTSTESEPMTKAEEKAAKKAAKEAERAAKEAERAAKEAAKAAEKAAKEQEKAEKKAAKEAEKEAKKAEKEAEKNRYVRIEFITRDQLETATGKALTLENMNDIVGAMREQSLWETLGFNANDARNIAHRIHHSDSQTRGILRGLMNEPLARFKVVLVVNGHVNIGKA
jgi:membrane protein involved in colicin uptake